MKAISVVLVGVVAMASEALAKPLDLSDFAGRFGRGGSSAVTEEAREVAKKLRPWLPKDAKPHRSRSGGVLHERD